MPGLAARLRAGDVPPDGGWDMVEPAAPAAWGGVTGDVAILCLRQALVMPAAGLAWDARGVPVAAARLAAGGVVPVPPAAQGRIARGALVAGAGALRNYGHWMCDALPGLGYLHDAGLAARYPALMPPLAPWARDSAALFGLGHATLRARAVAVDTLVLLTSLNHYLHRAGALLTALADRLPRAGAPDAARRAVWLSRRGLTGRVLVDERRIEAALAAGGAAILRPQRRGVAAQRACVAGAAVLAGASGAAFANALFLPRGATLVELRPAAVAEPWMEAMAAALGLGHVVVRGGAPLPRSAVPAGVRLAQLPRRVLGRYHYAWRAEPDAVLAAVAAAAKAEVAAT